MAHPNRKYKDTLFRDLFGSPERKGNALALYNALAGTDYPDPAALELTTLDDVIYLSVKNDVSFLVGGEMVLLEHQSTPNPNMPLRGLAYFARLYSAYAERAGGAVYGRRLVRVPVPRYVVLYAGPEGRPEREVLRLSDAYGGAGDVEVVCTVYDVNEGRNAEIAEACPALAGYAFFLARVREYNGRAGLSLEEAVAAAIEDCIREGHLAEYLKAKRAEVFDMFMTEYDEAAQRAYDRREGYEDGFEAGVEQGLEQGIEQLLAQLVEDGTLTSEQAAEKRGALAGSRG